MHGAVQSAPKTSASVFLPERRDLRSLREAAAHCEGCPLFEHATQTVFGEAVQPKLIVCLGATAAQALLGSAFRVTRDRGRPIEVPGRPPVLATVHPSSILRAPDDAAREEARLGFVADLRQAAALLRK